MNGSGVLKKKLIKLFVRSKINKDLTATDLEKEGELNNRNLDIHTIYRFLNNKCGLNTRKK